jgi:Fe-S cluster assembly protein SufB
MAIDNLDFSRYQLGWSDDLLPVFKPKKGLNESIVREMSAMKNEEPWMLKFRLDALKRFEKKPMLPWFADRMPDLDFNDIYYYVKPTDHQVNSWEDLPDEIKNTYEKLGIPEAERKYLAGVTAQYESEVVFHRNREDLERLGVLFCDMDTAVREYPDLVRKYFGTIIPPNDNKFAALNSAVWSGGSFIYVPPGVKVDQPLQAYFRINTENMGQFERTLIIADEGSQVQRRSTRRTPCTRRWWNSSPCRDRALPTRQFKTGRTTCTTWSPSARAPKPNRTSSGLTATLVRV